MNVNRWSLGVELTVVCRAQSQQRHLSISWRERVERFRSNCAWSVHGERGRIEFVMVRVMGLSVAYLGLRVTGLGKVRTVGFALRPRPGLIHRNASGDEPEGI